MARSCTASDNSSASLGFEAKLWLAADKLRSKRVAIECKFNVRRDFEKTVGIARLLCELLCCNSAIIVVPFVDDAVEAATRESPKIRACTPADVVVELKEDA